MPMTFQVFRTISSVGVQHSLKLPAPRRIIKIPNETGRMETLRGETRRGHLKFSCVNSCGFSAALRAMGRLPSPPHPDYVSRRTHATNIIFLFISVRIYRLIHKSFVEYYHVLVASVKITLETTCRIRFLISFILTLLIHRHSILIRLTLFYVVVLLCCYIILRYLKGIFRLTLFYIVIL